ncbi:MAG: hypothetical protein CBC35_12000 [Planctomycetes bacterium TMED75]|nr:hypothetical protein [Planctomycetaceae bacterium]OUU90452.1 MAG: hypothetical protein CBC35_12000 [Planctomycetes bacterium TMED75]
MTLRRRFRLWLLFLLVLSVAAVSVATIRLWLLMVCGPILVSSWYLCEGHRPLILSRFLVNVGSVLTLLLVGLSWLSNPDPGRVMELLGIFVLVLIVLRQFQDRSTREDAQQIILSSVLVISSTIQSDRFLFGIILLLWVVNLIYVVMLFQVYSGARHARQQRFDCIPKDGIPVAPLEIRFGPRDLSRMRLLAFGSSLAILLISVLVFILFPRQILFRSGVPGNRSVQKSGFAETVDLISSERITSSRREVFTVQWVDPGGESTKWARPLLLRGAILERYDSAVGRWVANKSQSTNSLVSIKAAPDRFTGLGVENIDQQIQTYTLWFEMRSMATDIFFAPWVPISITTFDPREIVFNRANMLMTDSGRRSISSYGGYGLRVQPFPNRSSLESLEGGAPKTSFIPRFPVPGIREFTLDVLEQMEVDPSPIKNETIWQKNRRVSDEILEWLENNCMYTTDLREFVQIAGEDPIESFLTRYRFGHCEYFASALTAMCRSVGIESRLVTGFVAIEYDEGIQRYIVRESNAHAWTEVRTGDYQWTALDPSPRSVLEELQAANESWSDSWRWVYDRVDFFWNSAIVGFDQRSQENLTQRFAGNWGDSFSDTFSSLRDWMASVNRFFKLGIAGYIWMAGVLLIFICFLLVAISILRRRRRLLASFRLGSGDRRLRRRLSHDLLFWAVALQRLAKFGYAKQAQETPLAFSRRVVEANPESEPTMQTLVRQLYLIRFGGGTLDRNERTQALELARKIPLRRRSS